MVQVYKLDETMEAGEVKVKVAVVFDQVPNIITCLPELTAEELCIILCKKYNIPPITRTLFALRIRGTKNFLKDNDKVLNYKKDYELRIRFKMPRLSLLMTLDETTYNYYFQQARNDVNNNQVPEIKYIDHKDELLGFGVMDMARAVLEDNQEQENVVKNYKKYIPNIVVKKHGIVAKKRAKENYFPKLCSTADVYRLKKSYLQQLYILAPNYLAEEFEDVLWQTGSDETVPVTLVVAPFHPQYPGIRFYNTITREWSHVCKIEELIYLTRKENCSLEVSRRGTPMFFVFNTREQLSSFISLCDGYYRLMVKWTFNLSKDDETPSLLKLHEMKCHGPVGGAFSYRKLEGKRGKKHGCYILRQCQEDYNIYYLDVCTQNSTTETYKIEFKGNHYEFNNEKYPYFKDIVDSHQNPQDKIFLNECILPSEYDKSQLLLCGETQKTGVRIDQEELQEILKDNKCPRCLPTKNISLYSGPWCYMKTEKRNVFEKRYCDIPFCDVKESAFVSREAQTYSHFITLKPSQTNISFGIRLWNPDDENAAAVRILLSTLSIPKNEDNVNLWDKVVELRISNNETGITFGNKHLYLEPTPGILKATEYTNFAVSWDNNVLKLCSPCLPWIDVMRQVFEIEIDDKVSEVGTMLNYCRNIDKRHTGPWCYVETPEGVKAEICNVRKCDSFICKHAGTANDYIGNLNVTRSNRTCKKWKKEFVVKYNLWTNTDNNVHNANNYCRNPTKSAGGAWCFTNDKRLKRDLCDIKDCDKSENRIVLSSRGANKRLTYILPNWRSIVPVKKSSENVTVTYKALWTLDETKKIVVAFKSLQKEKVAEHFKDFIDLASKWACIQSSSIVRLYGVTLSSPTALVLEFLPYGPFDVYLRENPESITGVHLKMVAAGLARALWDLSEAGVVHGHIRCKRLLLASLDTSRIVVKLSGPSLAPYIPQIDVHWMPVECFHDMSLAKRLVAADIWAFATTLWEVFSYGQSPTETNPVKTAKSYERGDRLLRPSRCPKEVSDIMKRCWGPDPPRPQEIMRDMNYMLHRDFAPADPPYQVIMKPHIDLYPVNSDPVEIGSRTTILTGDTSGPDSISIDSGHSINNPGARQRTISSPSLDGAGYDSEPDDCEPGAALRLMESITSQGKTYLVSCSRKIGSGNYGHVYKGYMEPDNRQTARREVAVKKLSRRAARERTLLLDFKNELDIMKSLPHRNIVEILGYSYDGADVLIVMEYLEEGSLNFFLKHQGDRLKICNLLQFALDIACGMDYISAKHMVHRDLAARNILVVNKNHVKISDFGLARIIPREEDEYRLKTDRDLPLKWYAPESSVRPFNFSTKSDVWSYGVTAWEIFTRGLVEVPPTDARPVAERASCFTIPDGCPNDVFRHLMRDCWELDPNRRPTFLDLTYTCKRLIEEYKQFNK